MGNLSIRYIPEPEQLEAAKAFLTAETRYLYAVCATEAPYLAGHPRLSKNAQKVAETRRAEAAEALAALYEICNYSPGLVAACRTALELEGGK